MLTHSAVTPVCQTCPVTDHGVFDLAVIGAGPAGSVAAYGAARRGLKVALVDRRRFPRDKACGDGIGPTAVRELQRQGLGGIFENHDPIQFVTVLGPTQARTESAVQDVAGVKSNGYVISRLEFDDYLFRQAVAAGAHDFTGTRYLGTSDAATTRTIRLKDESGASSDLSAHLLVGADGAYSAVRKDLVSRNPPKRDYMGIAMRAYAQSPDFQPGGKVGPSILFGFITDLLPSYGWVFPLGDGRVNLGVGGPLADMQKRGTDLRQLLTGFVELLRARGIEVGALENRRAHQLPTIVGMPPRLTFERAALVGDAAAMINPVSGEGIANGVNSAARLAEVLPANLGDAEALRAALTGFERDFRAAHRLHFASCRLTVTLLRRRVAAPLVIRAIQKDPRVLDDAVDMLLGDGRLHGSTVLRALKAALP